MDNPQQKPFKSLKTMSKEKKSIVLIKCITMKLQVYSCLENWQNFFLDCVFTPNEARRVSSLIHAPGIRKHTTLVLLEGNLNQQLPSSGCKYSGTGPLMPCLVTIIRK